MKTTGFFLFHILSECFRKANYKNKSNPFEGDGKTVETNTGWHFPVGETDGHHCLLVAVFPHLHAQPIVPEALWLSLLVITLWADFLHILVEGTSSWAWPRGLGRLPLANSFSLCISIRCEILNADLSSRFHKGVSSVGQQLHFSCVFPETHTVSGEEEAPSKHFQLF